VRACCCPPFKDDPDLLRELGEYAMQDVRAMRAISKAMRDLSDTELRDYHVNARINLRGVQIDRALCAAAVRVSNTERRRATARWRGKRIQVEIHTVRVLTQCLLS
jgi:DNA polymerase